MDTNYEKLLLDKMEKSSKKNTSWQDVINILETKNDEFNKKILKMDKLDNQAQDEALRFFVR